LKCFAAELRGIKPSKIKILTTGGTIAGTASSSTIFNYQAATVGVEALIQAVPELEDIANGNLRKL